MSDCLTDDMLALLLDGCLPSRQVTALHEHIDHCETCRVLLAEAAKAGPSVDAAISEPLPVQSVWGPGDQVGSYRLLHVLGEGGMGVVFAAVHATIGRRVAIKLLHRRLSGDPEFRARFLNEARAVNIVQHPGIVDIFEVGQLPAGDLYLVMEYLDGRPLRTAWPAASADVDPLARATVLERIRQIASTLQAAHDKGIIHRDLKPENVLLLRDGESSGGPGIKVLDFGLAKMSLGTRQSLQTRSGTVIGTDRNFADAPTDGVVNMRLRVAGLNG